MLYRKETSERQTSATTASTAIRRFVSLKGVYWSFLRSNEDFIFRTLNASYAAFEIQLPLRCAEVNILAYTNIFAHARASAR